MCWLLLVSLLLVLLLWLWLRLRLLGLRSVGAELLGS
jgi:hypothetical protein